MTRVETVVTDKWMIGLIADNPARPTVLIFEFEDRENISLAILPQNAIEIAKAILAQYENPPPPVERYEPSLDPSLPVPHRFSR
ncbi:hypothetical protein [Bradyrhizobium sp. CCBAU 53338]|uniref:hypothetical protein n=1 Tax=Bradyrhizobium sp. CCBAU 53338 TaxID=1325111 RepID=UPI00188D479F|nr:hypothetical protein [Bradyrhizobium sp. CCBAU 53338]